MTAALVALSLFGATVFNETFDRANQLYTQADYPGAINLYEQLVRDGVVDPNVFFNLGNAYYRNEQLGPAIANYERALHLSPHFESAARNLETCVGKTEKRLARPLPPAWEQSLLFWHFRLAPGTVRVLASLCWLSFWVVLAARQWRVIPYSRLAAILLLLASAAFGTSSWAKSHPLSLAVASAERVPVRYGIGENETIRFELGEGDRVAIESRSGNWARVRTSNGERGWVDLSNTTVVGPPYERPSQSVNVSGSGAGEG
ncbi:MAG: tetratricopeptide repeat protein [Candidatus Hydrogenedentales bacterium]|jgi:tetratricopeptide (TPR) repeat protein